jgi:hypothetical protein
MTLFFEHIYKDYFKVVPNSLKAVRLGLFKSREDADFNRQPQHNRSIILTRWGARK